MHILFRRSLILILAGVLSGCGMLVHAELNSGEGPQNGLSAEVPATAEVTPTVSLHATAPPDAAPQDPAVADERASGGATRLSDYGEVIVPPLNLRLEVPRSAARDEPLWEWMVDDVPEGRFGFNCMPFRPPMEPEAILPDHAVVVESEVAELPWDDGRDYLMEIYAPAAEPSDSEADDAEAPIASVERHIVAPATVAGELYLLDFYASAPTAEDLARLEGRLIHLAHTVDGLGADEMGEPPRVTTVDIPDVGLSFKVPAGTQQEMAGVWSVNSFQDGERVLNAMLDFNVMAYAPPLEPEAILPNPSMILSSEAVEHEIGAGRSYVLETYAPTTDAAASGERETQAPVESVERHVVLRVETETGRYLVDFYASAASAEGLERIAPLLEEMVERARLE